MKESLDFLVEVNKLKEMPRTGWVLMGVENPETVADHTFWVAMATWLLSQKKNLNTERAIQTAIFHDLCETYSGDKTPFFYYNDLPKDKKDKEKILMKWVRLSRKDKEKRSKAKLQKEKKALLKLTESLKPQLKKEILSLWLDYEKRRSKEGRFVKQLDRIDTLLKSIEYFDAKKKDGGTSWWELTEEIVDDPLLLEFLKIIQKRFYGRIFEKIKSRLDIFKKTSSRERRDLEATLEFLLKMGKLKRMPRAYWTIREVKNPETVSGHIFTLFLMAWFFGREKKPKLNLGKLLKMALCHEISAVYTGDTTPYDKFLPRDKTKKREVLKKWPRLRKKKKTRIFLKDYKEEKKAMKKLTSKLSPALRKEMVQLWKEYRTRSTPEGHFLSQLNVMAVLLQALLYEKEDKNFSATPIWEWALEISDSPINFELMSEMKKKFY
jgi:putative hydrolase of HD superfamily